jgi:hypothetical protein
VLDLAFNRLELPPSGKEGEEAKEGGSAAESHAEAAASVARLLPTSLRIVDLRGNPGLENGASSNNRPKRVTGALRVHLLFAFEIKSRSRRGRLRVF